MIEDELIKIWQSSCNQERIKFEKSRLMMELQSSLRRLNRWWKYLELVGVICALIVIPLFVFMVYWAPYTSTKIGAVLMLIFVIYLLFRTRSIKKFKPSDLEENYLEYLKKSREYLKAQKNLLETYIYWTSPIFPIIFLLNVGFWDIPSKRYVIIMSYLMLLGVQIYGYFLNKRRAKNEIDPSIKKVDELIESLKE